MTQVGTTRTNLLEAASRIVRQDGAAQLTLERVAKEAGVSKGGLLYHFNTKDALVTALLESYLDAADSQLRAGCETDTSPGAWARANLKVAADETGSVEGGTALLAAALTNPQLLGGARETFGRWQREAEADDLDPGVGTLLRLALDGWYFACLLDLAPPQGEERTAFEAAYIRFTRGGSR